MILKISKPQNSIGSGRYTHRPPAPIWRKPQTTFTSSCKSFHRKKAGEKNIKRLKRFPLRPNYPCLQRLPLPRLQNPFSTTFISLVLKSTVMSNMLPKVNKMSKLKRKHLFRAYDSSCTEKIRVRYFSPHPVPTLDSFEIPNRVRFL